MSALQRALKIRPGETRLVLSMTTLSFVGMAGLAMVEQLMAKLQLNSAQHRVKRSRTVETQRPRFRSRAPRPPDFG